MEQVFDGPKGQKIAATTLDVDTDRLPSQTITRQDYEKLGGIVVNKQLGYVSDTESPGGIQRRNSQDY